MRFSNIFFSFENLISIFSQGTEALTKCCFIYFILNDKIIFYLFHNALESGVFISQIYDSFKQITV
jgi:hypothetical protein